VLATADRDTLAAYCSAVADLEALSAAIDRDGLVIEVPALDRNGRPTGAMIRKPNPLIKWKSDALNRVKQLAAEFGLTPAARSRAGATAAPERDQPNRVIQIRDRITAMRAAGG
jgi:P27 family predicted phage terminase small subunit